MQFYADFTAPGNIVIKHLKDHFSFSNPGTLLVSLRQYYEGGVSECRNPSLQKMFLMIGTAEKAGSGVNKIMAGWEYAHWRRPFLRIENQPDRLILELPMFSIIPENTLVELRELYGDVIDSFGKNELTILSTCAIEGEISNNRLQYLLDLHRTDITSLLQDLCRSGYLISENKGRWTTYHLNYDFSKEFMSSQNGVPSKEVATLFDEEVATPEIKVATLDEEVATFDGKVASSVNIPRERISRHELFVKIREACSEEFITLDEIAAKVNRNYQYLKNKVIQEMLDAGLIERLHPNIPNHPSQAYKASKKTNT